MTSRHEGEAGGRPNSGEGTDRARASGVRRWLWGLGALAVLGAGLGVGFGAGLGLAGAGGGSAAATSTPATTAPPASTGGVPGAPSDRVVIMLTQGPDPAHQTQYTMTELWEINLAVSLANRALASGRPTTLFLDVHAPALARRSLSPTLHFRSEIPIKTQLANFVKDGGVVMICPLCAETMGVTPSQVIPGVTFNDAGIFGPNGLAPGAVSLSF